MFPLVTQPETNHSTVQEDRPREPKTVAPTLLGGLVRKILMLAAAVVASLTPAIGRSDPIGPTPAAYVVVGDEVIDGGTHTWDMPVVIGPASSLTIKNATVYLDWRPPVCFHGTTAVCPAGVQVLGGTLRIHDSIIDTHDYDIDDGWSGYKILGNGATFDFQRSTFLHQENMGTQGPGLERSIFKDNRYDYATTAIRLWRGAEADIIGNEFSHILYGVELQDTSGLIVDNHFHDIDRSWGSSRAIGIQSTAVGQKHFVTQPIVRNNVIEDGPRSLGILSLNGFPNVFEGNIIRNMAAGATIGLLAGNHEYKEHSIWKRNVFDGNELQIQVYTSGVPDEVENVAFKIDDNSFIGDSCTDIRRRETHQLVFLSIDANDNWWGSQSGPRANKNGTCPRFDGGGITVDTWLNSAP